MPTVWPHVASLLDDLLERTSDVFLPFWEQPNRAGVPIYGVAADPVGARDACRARPIDESLIDLVTPGMSADAAFCTMPDEGNVSIPLPLRRSPLRFSHHVTHENKTA